MRIVMLFATGIVLAVWTTAMAADMGMPHAGGHAAHGATRHDPSAVDYSTTRWSDHRRFRVSYVPSSPPPAINTLQAWTLTVRDAAGRAVPEAVIAVDGDMPEHEHGLPTTPQVRSLGGGTYLLEGLKFHMPGWWVVKLAITADGTTDETTFNLKLE